MDGVQKFLAIVVLAISVMTCVTVPSIVYMATHRSACPCGESCQCENCCCKGK